MIDGYLLPRSRRAARWAWRLSAVVVAVVIGVVLAGRFGPTQVSQSTARGGTLRVTNAYFTSAKHPTLDDAADGYLTITNASATTAQIDAVTSPDVTTADLHHGSLQSAGSPGGSLAHLYCGDLPADPSDHSSIRYTDDDPLVIPAHSIVTIVPGHGRLTLSAPPGKLRPGRPISITLHLDDGSQLHFVAPLH
jgi:copper(I)-binding protein